MTKHEVILTLAELKRTVEGEVARIGRSRLYKTDKLRQILLEKRKIEALDLTIGIVEKLMPEQVLKVSEKE